MAYVNKIAPLIPLLCLGLLSCSQETAPTSPPTTVAPPVSISPAEQAREKAIREAVSAETSNLFAMVGKAKSVFVGPNQNDVATPTQYINISNQLMIDVEAVPSAMVSPPKDTTQPVPVDQIHSTWGTPVLITPVGEGAMFSITYSNVPAQYCQRLAAELIPKFHEVKVNATPFTPNNAPPQKVEQACAASAPTGANIVITSD